MQPGQIPTLTFPANAQAASAAGQTTAQANGQGTPASGLAFNNLLAGLTRGSHATLPAAATPAPAALSNASDQGLLHANIRSVLGGNPLAAGTDFTASATPGSDAPVPTATDGTVTETGLEAALLANQQTPEAQAVTTGATQSGLAVATTTGTETLTGSATAQAGTAPVQPGTTAPAATGPMTAPVQASGDSATTTPSGPAITGNSTGTAPVTGQATTDAAQLSAQTGQAGATSNAATTTDNPAAKTAQLPGHAAPAAQSATQDNAKAGIKSSVLAKLPTQARPAQSNLPQPTSPAPTPAVPNGQGNPAVTGSPAQPQSVAQAQALNGAQTSVTAASQLPAEAQGLKASTGLKESSETRAILQPRGASALAAGQSSSASQTNASAATATATAKPDTTAAVPTTTSPGAEPALPVQRELPAGFQPTTAQPGVAPTAGLETAPLLSGGETNDGSATADIDLQAGRMLDARVAGDRNGAHLPRFAAHTTQTLAGQITRQFNQGNRVFDIRLDPAELGKVDVRLEMRADNRVHAVLTAERPDTLMELQRNARELERALNEAGLELGEDGLDFQMQEDGQSAAENSADESGASIPVFTESETDELSSVAIEADAPRSTYGFLLSRREGVDVRV